MIKQIIITLFASILTILFAAQYHPWVHTKCSQYITNYLEQESPSYKAICTPVSINFFTPEFIFDTIQVTDTQESKWRWSAQRISLSFSWLNLIRYRRLDIEIRLYECHINSSLDNTILAIEPYITYFFAPSSLPIACTLKLIEFNKSSLYIEDKNNHIQTFFTFNSISKEIETVFKTRVRFIDGAITIQKRKLISRITGTTHLELAPSLSNSESKTPFKATVQIHTEIPYLDKPTCFITGTWEYTSGRFSLRHVEQACTIDPLIITTTKNQELKIDLTARCPLSFLWRLITNDPTAHTVHGTCLLKTRGGIIEANTLKGQITLENITYNSTLLCSALSMTVQKLKNQFQGQFTTHRENREFEGSWHLQTDTGNAALSIQNSRRFTVPYLPYWYIEKGGFTSTFHKTSTDSYKGSHQCIAHSTLNNIPFISQGSFKTEHTMTKVHGTINNYTYQGTGSLSQAPYLTTLISTAANGEPILTIKGMPPATAWSGTLSYVLVQSLLKTITGLDLPGKGNLDFAIRYAHNQAQAHITLKKGTIQLPFTYNFIDRLTAHLTGTFNDRSLSLDHLFCGLHTGTIQCTQGCLKWETDHHLSFMHVPLVFNRCLLNIRNSLFALLSGHILLNQNAPSHPLLSGHVIVDRAQIKDVLTPWSNTPETHNRETYLSPKSPLFNTHLNLAIEAKNPIRIDTPLLKTHVYGRIHSTGTITNPLLEGTLTLDAGSLILPYKPLSITKGILNFDPDTAPTNPFIELRASNTIKNYIVNLYVQGSLREHHVVLDSNPPLTEEQIISLLLVGSPEESLNTLMPALIIHNLKTALMGSGSLSLFDSYLKRKSLPFTINLIPSFADQTGRGGLRGSIEIIVNDRWRALIQKNFSLSEDTRFELEYLFTDDIGIRIVRDERRDIGGEIEMRWKF